MQRIPENAARAFAFAGLQRFLSPKSIECLRRDLERCGVRDSGRAAADWGARRFSSLCFSARLPALWCYGVGEVLLGLAGAFVFEEGAAAQATLAQRAAVQGAVVLGAQIYLLLFAAIAGFFVASAEGVKRKAVLYFAFMAPAALLVFHALQAVSIT
ncbi:MAG: hypothetical protein QW343_03465 [Candidatus Norongarragalinales archaeon]